MLMKLRKPDPRTVTLDFSFLHDPQLCHLRVRKRGKRGGVRLRMRRRKFKLPLPSIVLGNAQSLGNKCDELSACCQHMHEFRDASLICFSETWLKEDHADPDIPNFSVFRGDRSAEVTGKSRGGGVCVFVNNRWCTNTTVKENLCSPDIELLSISLRPFYLPREFNQIFITVVYIHPRANLKTAVNTLSDVIHRLSSLAPDAPSFILGDFNKCRLNKALPTFRQYVTCNTCGDNTLDLCYGNIKSAFQSRALPNLGRSIHQMVQLIPVYKQKLKQSKPMVKTVKVWSQESADRLNACFDCTDWSVFLDEDTTLDETTDVISSYINFCVDTVLPTKEIKIYQNSKPWITKDLKHLLKERQSALKEKDTKKMKLTQKKIDQRIREEKKKYSAKLEDNFRQGDPRQCWQNISTITGYKPKKAELRPDDEMKLANELNVFYTRFDQHDFSLEQHQAMDTVHQIPGSPVVITEEEVRRLFKKLNARSASGPDGISSKTLKICSDSLAHVFKTLYERSLEEGHIPNIWRSSMIIPVPKKKVVSQLNDYRPVALTSVPMKCAEKIILKHLRRETANHQDPLQFAYTTKRSPEDAILTMLHNLHQHLDKPGTYARILFVDFSSAFNTIQPHLLVSKLLNMTVNPKIIDWIFSFLTNRPQRVLIGQAVSDVLVTNTGAPQGCVLSPALFTIYTADCRTKESCSLQIKFADDTSLTGLICDSDETRYREAVAELVDWCDSNYLQLNVTKTEEMIFDFRKNTSDIQPLVIKQEEVRTVHTYKYLGTVIDDKLEWTPNIDASCKKANQRLFFLRKLRQFKINSTILNLFYEAVIQSTLLYNHLCFFSSLSEADKGRLEKIVTAAGKAIGQNPKSLVEIHTKASSKKAWVILKDQSHPLNPTLSACISKRNTGRLLSMRSRTSRFKDSFLPSAIRIVNEASRRN